MPIVYLILGGIIACNATWWRWADTRLKQIKGSVIWRLLLGIFVVGQMIYLGTLLTPRSAHRMQRWVPIPFIATTYLWSLLVLPVSLMVIGVGKLAWKKRNAGAEYSALRSTSESGLEVEKAAISRREMLSAAAVAVPPIVTAGLVMRGVPQLDRFRVRTIHLKLPGLSSNLDGIRIAHVSDLHVGRYTRPAQIPRMVEAVNKLAADLVLFTGDLIDMSLDDLPRGIDALKQIDPRSGMAIIEGNHDLIDNADEFDRRVKRAGLPLLIDEAITVRVRGEAIQLLGTRWGESIGNRRKTNEKAFVQSIDQVSKLRDPGAFPIVLAHHPHAFNAAAAADFPLVLSGHTHGGQLMLTPQVGFGPLFYRYWSGVYRKNAGQLVVNNGVGNWFPLRVNAPAEIIALVLHPMG